MKYKYSIINDNKSNVKNNLLKDLIDNYDSIEFYYNDYGKPYIKNSDIYFNVSHSFLYVIAVVSEKEIGIDIENIRPVYDELIDFIATKKEKEYIYSKDVDKETRVFEIYTLKEAYFKMLGTGIQDFKSIEFTIKNNKVTCSDKNINAYIYYDIDGYDFSICEKNC